MFGFDFNKIFGAPKDKQDIKAIREKQLADLQKRKNDLTEKANHLAKEKELCEEIVKQEKRIKENTPANAMGNVFSMVPAKWRKPLIIIGILVIILIVAVKSCGGQ
jgi:uncharacterized protein YlxW (UPF0749 family)